MQQRSKKFFDKIGVFKDQEFMKQIQNQQLNPSGGANRSFANVND